MVNETWKNLVAGAAAGSIADIVTHPLSTVKTRLQCQGASQSGELHRGPISSLFTILRVEGAGALYRGIGIVIAAAAPAQALYFAGYEAFRQVSGTSVAGNFGGGIAAQFCASLIWVPMDVVKERLQIEGQIKTNEKFGGSLNAFKQIVKNEGVLGLYRAYWLHNLVWAPFNGLYFATYEKTKQTILDNGYLQAGTILNLSSGVVAGTFASFLTSPIDLVKTRLQVQASNPLIFDYTGPIDATMKIIKREGMIALFDGVAARILWLTPRLSIAVSSYDIIKTYLNEEFV